RSPVRSDCDRAPRGEPRPADPARDVPGGSPGGTPVADRCEKSTKRADAAEPGLSADPADLATRPDRAGRQVEESSPNGEAEAFSRAQGSRPVARNRSMRLARLVLLLAASLAAPAGADEPLRVSAAALGADGGLGARVADVLGGDGPSYTRVLAIEAPPAGGRIAGQVEVFEIDGEAWIELVAVQADGRRAVARTTDPGRAAPRLVGSAPPRSFALDAPADPGGAAPVHLELAVGML